MKSEGCIMFWDVKIWRSDRCGLFYPSPASQQTSSESSCEGSPYLCRSDDECTNGCLWDLNLWGSFIPQHWYLWTGSVIRLWIWTLFSEHWTLDLVCMCWGQAGGGRLEACSWTRSCPRVNPALLNPVSKTPITISDHMKIVQTEICSCRTVHHTHKFNISPTTCVWE